MSLGLPPNSFFQNDISGSLFCNTDFKNGFAYGFFSAHQRGVRVIGKEEGEFARLEREPGFRFAVEKFDCRAFRRSPNRFSDGPVYPAVGFFPADGDLDGRCVSKCASGLASALLLIGSLPIKRRMFGFAHGT